MKQLIFLIAIVLTFSSCSHRVIRSGYDTTNKNTQSEQIVIKKQIIVPDSVAAKVGNIRIGDSGFSTSCNEADALQILAKEAQLANANLIIITKEQRPDAISSCYRCTADFYKYKSPFYHSLYSTDEKYQEIYVDSRVIVDKKNQAGMIIGVIAGVALGILLAIALF